LFSFLSDDGSDERDVLRIAVGSETSKSILECAENYVGERASEADRRVEVGRREDVLARFDRSLAGSTKDAIGAECVQLLLRQDGSERIDDDGLHSRATDFEAWDTAGDVVEQTREEGHLEELVEGDEFEYGNVAVLESGR